MSKRFRSLRVLDRFSLMVREAEFYALLDPNGAGKSTLIRLLLGLLTPEAGSLALLGESPEKAVARVSYLPEHPHYFARLSPTARARTQGMRSIPPGSASSW